jgi:hypothetical protein
MVVRPYRFVLRYVPSPGYAESATLPVIARAELEIAQSRPSKDLHAFKSGRGSRPFGVGCWQPFSVLQVRVCSERGPSQAETSTA